MNDLHEIEDRLRDATRAYAEQAEPAPDAWDQISRRARAASRRRRAILIVGASAIAAAAVFTGALMLGGNPTRRVKTPAAGPSTTTTIWRGPVREPSAVVHRMTRSLTWKDPLDTPVGWADVNRVGLLNNYAYAGTWSIQLAAKRPIAADLEPGTLVAYGLVFDTTRDGVADYVVGIDNDAPKPGEYHTWVTDLATGETDEGIEPPYGFPGDFGYPDDQKKDPAGPSTATFAFLRGSKLGDPNLVGARWYAWTSVSRDGEILANDYAPDTGWMSASGR